MYCDQCPQSVIEDFYADKRILRCMADGPKQGRVCTNPSRFLFINVLAPEWCPVKTKGEIKNGH